VEGTRPHVTHFFSVGTGVPVPVQIKDNHRGSVDKPKIYNNLILPVIPNLVGDPFKILNFKEIDGFPIRSGMTRIKGFISLLTFSTCHRGLSLHQVSQLS